MNYYAVFDIGGTHVKWALMNDEADLLEKGKRNTPKDDLSELVELIHDQVQNLQRQHPLSGLALSCPGAVDSESGIIGGHSAVPYIHGFNFKQLLSQHIGLPVELCNDANAAGLAEVWRGVAKSCQDVCFVVCGTGIGGAVIKDKQLHEGHHLHGGEFGYMIMDYDQQSGKALTWSDVGATYILVKNVAKRLNMDPFQLNGETVFAWAEAGNTICQEEIDRFYRYFAMGIFNLQYMYDPEMIVVGGAISARDELVNEIDRRLDQLIEEIRFAKVKPLVKRCHYTGDANLIGALYHFLQRNRLAQV